MRKSGKKTGEKRSMSNVKDQLKVIQMWLMPKWSIIIKYPWHKRCKVSIELCRKQFWKLSQSIPCQSVEGGERRASSNVKYQLKVIQMWLMPKWSIIIKYPRHKRCKVSIELCRKQFWKLSKVFLAKVMWENRVKKRARSDPCLMWSTNWKLSKCGWCQSEAMRI